MSVAGGFRRLQVLHDLSQVAASACPETLARIAQGIPGVKPMALAQVILTDKAEPSLTADVADAIQLGAARPDEDFDAFIVCLSVLVRDRLTQGALSAPLYWVWESHHDHIALADDAHRAAIVQGLAEAQLAKLDQFDPPPFAPVESTDTTNQIMDALENILSQSPPPRQNAMASRNHDPLGSVEAPDFVGAAAAVIYGALHAPDRVDVANSLWRRQGAALAGSQAAWADPIRRAFRHLFEINPRFDPWPDAERSQDVTLIPPVQDTAITSQVRHRTGTGS